MSVDYEVSPTADVVRTHREGNARDDVTTQLLTPPDFPITQVTAKRCCIRGERAKKIINSKGKLSFSYGTET